MNNLYEALELCLQDIEQGADIETVLFRYPDLADELRPILEASVQARGMAVSAPSVDIVRRNRTKVLQHAAQIREAKSARSGRVWFASLRRLAVTLAVVVALFVSGTGLVRAASMTLPGDNLYPVKRTWEDVLLLFTFNLQEREALEIEHENERLYELMDLFAKGRSEDVDFSGWLTAQNGNEWVVAGVRVVISPETEIRDGPIAIGSAIRVRGWTQENGTVLAERIRLLSPTDRLPDVEYEPEAEEDSNEGANQQNEDNSGPGSGGENPAVEQTKTPEPESESQDETINSVSDNDNSGSGSNDNGNENDNDNTNDNSGSDDRGDDDNSGSNSNDDSDSDDDDNDSGGGGGSSGSGGGDGDDD